MKNFLKSRTIQAAIISLLGVGLIVYFQQSTKTTNYAPQTATTTSGSIIQLQGNGNKIETIPDHEPITQYNILTKSERLSDGLFHTKIEVLVAFDKKGGLHISPKLYCDEYKDRERRPFHFEGVYYSGLVFNVECTSPESIQEGNSEYFEYINND